MTFSEVPNVLVLHLKRFSYGNLFGKITRHVQFPLELTVTSIDERNNNTMHKYSLVGVTVHFGHSTHSGHYIAYVKVKNEFLYC